MALIDQTIAVTKTLSWGNSSRFSVKLYHQQFCKMKTIIRDYIVMNSCEGKHHYQETSIKTEPITCTECEQIINPWNESSKDWSWTKAKNNCVTNNQGKMNEKNIANFDNFVIIFHLKDNVLVSLPCLNSAQRFFSFHNYLVLEGTVG